MKSPDRADRPGRRGGTHGARSVPQVRQVLGDVEIPDRSQRAASTSGQGGRVTVEIAPVRQYGVRRDSALDCEMVEVRPDLFLERGQVSTSSSFTADSPCASATGP